MDFSPAHLDMLLSRLFHDLISPVGAARNGLELLKEFGSDEVGADAMELAADSTEQATARLTYFRMAFGGAGSAPGHGFVEADRVIRGYLSSRRIEWAMNGAAGVPPPQTGAIKVLMGAAAVVADALPRLGRITAEVGSDRARLVGEGDGAGFEPAVQEALAGRAEGRDERTVLAATVCINARRFGIGLATEAAAPPSLTITFAAS